MREHLRDLLVCPACRGELTWDIFEVENSDTQIAIEDTGVGGARAPDYDVMEGRAECSACGATYSVKDGIGAFLTPDVQREDLWEEVDSHLSAFLRENPEIDERLTKSPLESLSGVDRFFRSMVLMERGDYAGAREAASNLGGIYTPEYEAGQRSQIEHVLNLVSAASGLIVDLASGVGTLVERLACCFPDRQVVVTDFSPRVLRRNKKYLHYLGIDKNLDFLAFDVRRVPFRDDCVPVFTSHVGLQNIRYPRRAVAEISRTLKGYMFATSIFYPKGDLETDQLLRENGLADLCYMDSALKVFTESGLRVSVENLMEVRAQPTPRSELLGGAGFDALPVKEMAISWCTLVARH